MKKKGGKTDHEKTDQKKETTPAQSANANTTNPTQSQSTIDERLIQQIEQAQKNGTYKRSIQNRGIL